MDTTSHLVEVRLAARDDFKIIVETLTRIGIPSATETKLLQICFLLHKQGRYFICHYKELFALDGFDDDPMTTADHARRNKITALLVDWGLLTLVDPKQIVSPQCEMTELRILRHSDKPHWRLIPKYEIGRKRAPQPARMQ
jgi:hypothetical protein